MEPLNCILERPRPIAIGDFFLFQTDRYNEALLILTVMPEVSSLGFVNLTTGARFSVVVPVANARNVSSEEAKRLCLEAGSYYRLTRAEAAKWLADHA